MPHYIPLEAKYLSQADHTKIEREASKSREGIAVLLSLYAGLRIGEICALKWDDIDFEEGFITISRTRQRVKTESKDTRSKTVVIESDTKTHSSRRTIPLLGFLAVTLSEHKREVGGDYVITSNGEAVEPRTIQYRFGVLLKKAKVRPVNFHVLRHTFATQCLESGMDVVTLSGIMGHASSKMTLDRYGHSRMEHKREAMRLFDGMRRHLSPGLSSAVA